MADTNKRKKVITIGSLLITAVLLISADIMFRNYNVAEKAIIENLIGGTLGAKATIGEVRFNTEQGTARIGHLRIFNPGKGFSDGAAVEIENIDITILPAAPGVINLGEILVSGIQSNLEVTPKNSNLSAITARMKSKKPDAYPDDVARMKLVVQTASASNIRVRPRSLIIEGKGHPIVKLPDMVFAPASVNGQPVPVKMAITQAWLQLSTYLQSGARSAGYLEGMKETPMAVLVPEPESKADSHAKEPYEEEPEESSNDHIISE